MEGTIQKIEQLFSEAKKNPDSASDPFFEEAWKTISEASNKDRIELSQRIYDWAESISDTYPKLLGYAFLAQGEACLLNEKYELAIDLSSKALKLFTSLADEEGEALCTMLNGNIYRPLGDIELALKYLLEAYPLIRKTEKYKYFRCITCFNIAEIYSDTNHLSEAMKLYVEMATIASENGFDYLSGMANNGIACVNIKQHKYGLGLDYFNKALDISKQVQYKPFQARVLTDLGDYYIKSGDYESAIKKNKEALEIRENEGVRGGVITNMMHMGNIYFKQSKPDEAIILLEKALVMAEEMNIKPKMFAMHEILSEIYASKNEMAKSLQHHKAFHEIREEVNNEDREKKVKNLQIIFEAEQTKKENTIIKAQKAEIERKNKELQETIDELTKTRASRRAKTITMGVAISLFVLEEVITELILHPNLPANNFLISLAANGIIVFSLKPIENAIEHYLLHHRFSRKKVKLESALT